MSRLEKNVEEVTVNPDMTGHDRFRAARKWARGQAVKTKKSPDGYDYVPVDDMIDLGNRALDEFGMLVVFESLDVDGAIVRLQSRLVSGDATMWHMTVQCDHETGRGPLSAGGEQAYLMAMTFRQVLSIAKVEREPDAAGSGPKQTEQSGTSPQVAMIEELLTALGYRDERHRQDRLRRAGMVAEELCDADGDELSGIVHALIAEKALGASTCA